MIAVQPQRARRGLTGVALTTLTCGVLLLVLAVVLTACGSGGSVAANGPGGSSTATTSGPATTTATSSGSASPTAAASATPGAGAGTDATPATDDPYAPVPTAARSTAPAVALTATSAPGNGVSVQLGQITDIQGEARLPGEIAGPAVEIPVTVVNGGRSPLDVGPAVVDLRDASGASAGPLSAPPASPFAGTLAPGERASAVYTFTLSTDDRRGVSLLVSFTTAVPVAVFTGDIA